jgi:hypothetical protein
MKNSIISAVPHRSLFVDSNHDPRFRTQHEGRAIERPQTRTITNGCQLTNPRGTTITFSDPLSTQISKVTHDHFERRYCMEAGG